MHILLLICVSQFPNFWLKGEKNPETIGELGMCIQESGSGMRGVLFHGLSGRDLGRRPGSSESTG